MNIFLVTSPFQYICANEAKDSYKTKDNVLVIVEQNKESGIRHFNQLLDESSWDKVIRIQRNNRTFVTPRVLKKLKEILNQKTLNHLFFAEFTSWRSRMFLRNLQPEKLIFIDDGMLNLYEYFHYIQKKKTFKRHRFIQDFLVICQGCKTVGVQPFPDNFEMFSIFDIPNAVCPLKVNKLNSIRKQINTEACFDSGAPVAFIGEGSIGDKNQPSIKNYIDRIKQLIKETGKEVLYFPHRTESDAVTDAVKSLPQIIYHHSEQPIELEIANKNIKISSISGITSTALYTLSILYQNVPISAHTYDSHVGDEMIEFLIQHFEQRKIS